MRDAKPHGQQCTATAKGTGQRCKQMAVTGYSVCRMHGAGSPKQGRPGGRPIVTGRYSKHLPERLAARYAEAQADPRLLELRSDIALVDVRLGELVARLDGKTPDGETWREVVELLDTRRRLVESESKRLQTMQQMITSQQAMVLLAAVVDTIRKHIQDRTVLAAISQDIRTLTAIDPPALETADRD